MAEYAPLRVAIIGTGNIAGPYANSLKTRPGKETLLRALGPGMIGRPLAAYAEMNWGHIEAWHPNPEGFYRPGSGPLLDVGVYALTVLTAVLGPVRRVTGFAGIVMPERTIARGP